ncbi:hypothetical protein [Nocardia paucivorans]|uniref:hypothetical protein n=1 Tax=Nocardia paucivorans TaxID=114259 RepID=UPI00030DE2BC|nr:hypothetical protein [Nocardia paucivorans]
MPAAGDRPARLSGSWWTAGARGIICHRYSDGRPHRTPRFNPLAVGVLSSNYIEKRRADSVRSDLDWLAAIVDVVAVRVKGAR